MGRIGVVAAWEWWGGLDLYIWLPNVSSPGGVVGAGYSGHSSDLGPGLLSDFPRACWNRDGGSGDRLSSESVSIVPRPGFPTMPYYNRTGNDYYDFLLADYGSGDPNQPITLRVWVGGKMIGYVDKTDACDSGEDWWYAGWLEFGAFTPVDSCGSSVLRPYAGGSGGIRGVPERPLTKR